MVWGLFERMIGTAKRCLKKVLGNARLNYEGLITVLTEIACTLNTRPLTYQYDDLVEALTPSHPLYGRKLSSLPEQVNIFSDENENELQSNITKRFSYLSRKLTYFWNRWSKEYLVDLREFHKVKDAKVSKITRGDSVLVQEENMKRGGWKTGVIEELIKGRDGVVRGAKVRRAGGKNETINRSVVKLIPLETAFPGYDKKEGKVDCDGNKKQVGSERNDGTNRNNIKAAVCSRNQPLRAAAKDSSWKSKIMLDT